MIYEHLSSFEIWPLKINLVTVTREISFLSLTSTVCEHKLENSQQNESLKVFSTKAANFALRVWPFSLIWPIIKNIYIAFVFKEENGQIALNASRGLIIYEKSRFCS